MTHTFDVDIACSYGVEEAVLLNNIGFWVVKNEANQVNMRNGKGYTYNTAEAFGGLFPYIKPRKIAELLRNMEYEGLIESHQLYGRDRVKSYTVTDKARELLGFSQHTKIRECNIQNLENATYENSRMQHTEFGYSSITDNKHTDVNIQISAKTQPIKKSKQKEPFLVPSVEEVAAYIESEHLDIDAQYFWFYYDARDWRFSSGKKMQKWKSTLKQWAARERKGRHEMAEDEVKLNEYPEPKTKGEKDGLIQDVY